jgi:hypothetical protein
LDKACWVQQGRSNWPKLATAWLHKQFDMQEKFVMSVNGGPCVPARYPVTSFRRGPMYWTQNKTFWLVEVNRMGSRHIRVGKTCPVTAMQALRTEVYLLLILDLGTRWEWVVSVRPRPCFTPGKGSPVPIGQNAGLGLRVDLDTDERGKI